MTLWDGLLVFIGVLVGGALAMMIGFVILLYGVMELISAIWGIENPMAIKRKNK